MRNIKKNIISIRLDQYNIILKKTEKMIQIKKEVKKLEISWKIPKVKELMD